MAVTTPETEKLKNWVKSLTGCWGFSGNAFKYLQTKPPPLPLSRSLSPLVFPEDCTKTWKYIFVFSGGWGSVPETGESIQQHAMIDNRGLVTDQHLSKSVDVCDEVRECLYSPRHDCQIKASLGRA